MAQISIPKKPRSPMNVREMEVFIEMCIRAIEQLKAEVERLEKDKQDA